VSSLERQSSRRRHDQRSRRRPVLGIVYVMGAIRNAWTWPAFTWTRAPWTTLGLAIVAAALVPVAAGDEGPLRNSTPLPDQQVASAALRGGDDAWDAALAAAAADRDSAQVRAFDGWRNALLLSTPGEGLRLLADPDARRAWLPDPDESHSRRSEDASAAVQRRLMAIPPAAREAWVRRFSGGADAALQRELGRDSASPAGLGEVERTFPGTVAAGRAALAAADLELERGHPFAATVWADRAVRHTALGGAAWGAPLKEALAAATSRRLEAIQRLRASTFVGDHTRPQGRLSLAPRRDPAEAPPASRLPSLRLQSTSRISGISRATEEPFGRGLGSGAAFFRDGAILTQGAYGVILTDHTEGGSVRASLDEIFGTNRTVVRASASAAGWKSYPACDGDRAALVFGRAQRRRPFLDIEVPPAGNMLGVLEHAPGEDALNPLWVMRDGYLVQRPTTRAKQEDPAAPPTAGASGRIVEGWDLGRGWEFQPGPVMLDGAIFALVRGVGDATHEASDHADEVRLLALDAASGALRWSREVTRERGLIDPALRGRAGSFATTTMPLTVDRTTGHLLVGTNVGLISAYDVADGRLAWALQTQRRRATDGGWPGSRPPLLVDQTAWFAPFDSEFAYPLPAGSAPLDGSLFAEAPRARRGAIDLAAVQQGAAGEPSTLVLFGRDGRFSAVLVEGPDGTRHPATYLAPDEQFAGRPALGLDGMFFSGTREVALLSPTAELRLVAAAPLPSRGAGRGGDVLLFDGRVYVIGRDTIWVWGLE